MNRTKEDSKKKPKDKESKISKLNKNMQGSKTSWRKKERLKRKREKIKLNT